MRHHEGRRPPPRRADPLAPEGGLTASPRRRPASRPPRRADPHRGDPNDDPSLEPAAAAPRTLPLVPLRDMVVFPRMMAPFVVGRASSIAALEAALASPEKRIFLAAQKDPKVDEPAAGDIHEIGVIAVGRPVAEAPERPHQGDGRGRRARRASAPSRPAPATSRSRVERLEPQPARRGGRRVAPYLQKVLAVFEQYAKLSHHLAFEGLLSSLKMDDPDVFADMLAGHLPTSIATAEKQALLETVNPLERLQKLQDLLEIEIEKINIDRRINNKVKKQMERAQKEYYLNEKIKAIHQELGKKDDKSDEIEELKRQDREGRDAEGDEGEGARRAEAARGDAERLRRGHRLAQLHRLARERALEEGLARDEGHQARREDPERGPLRPREGQGADPRVPRRPPARHGDEGLDPLLRRPSGRRQDVAREAHREVAQPQVRAPLARRRARRGRGPRPPAHVHRRVPGPDHPAHEEGGDGEPRLPPRRGRQDVDGLPGRPVGGAPRGPRPRAEPRLRGPLPRRRSTTSRR